MVHTINIEDLIKQNFQWVHESDSLSHALNKFGKETTVLMVLDEKKNYSGILVERAILRTGFNREKTKIKKLKSHAPKIDKQTSVPECARLMIENDVTHLPVFEKDKLVGVIDDTSILKSVTSKNFGKTKATELMINEVEVVETKTKLSEVLSLFREHHISRAPVLEKGKMAGIVGLTDIISKAFKPTESPGFGFIIDEKSSILDLPVEGVMEQNVVTVNNEATVKDVIEAMLNNHVLSVIVSSNHETAEGIITRKDLLQQLAETSEFKPYVQFSSKSENINREKMQDIMDRFVQKYSDKFQDTHFYVYVNFHKETLKDQRLAHVRLRTGGGAGRFAVSAEGYGETTALRNALLKLERRIHKAFRHTSTEDRKRFMDFVDVEHL